MAWKISGDTNYANIHKNSGILTYGTELCGGVPDDCTPDVNYSVSCYLEEDRDNFPKYSGDSYNGNIVRKNYNGKSCNQDMFVMWFNFPDNLSYSGILDTVKTDDETQKPLFDIKNVDDCEHVVISSDGSFRTGSQKFEENFYIDSGYPKIASNPCDSSDTSVKYSGETIGHKIKYHTINNRIPRYFYTNHTELVELYFPHMYVENSDEGKNIEEIGEYAFIGCDRLSAVTFGAVERIENYAFKSCSSLKSIDWGHINCCDSKVTYIGEDAFKNIICSIDLCLDKLKSIQTIDKGAFSNDDGNNNLSKNLTLPTATSYSAVSENCFENSHVRLLIDDDKKEPYKQIPNNIKKIGKRAFYGHISTSITIPNNVNEIGEKAFEANSVTNTRIVNEYCSGSIFNVSTSFDLTSWTEENFEKAEIGAYALGDTTTISEIKIKNGTRNAFLSKFGSDYSSKVVEVEEA